MISPTAITLSVCICITYYIGNNIDISNISKILNSIGSNFNEYDKGKVNCVNEEGEVVDWYFVYKLPKLQKLGTKGNEYLYIDSNNPKWKRGKVPINSRYSIIGKTLYPIYDLYDSKYIEYIFYNDGIPGSKNYSSKVGHTKGVMAWNSDSVTGFWLIHSVPRFPPSPVLGYNYPYSGYVYGQSMLCINLDYKGGLTALDNTLPVNNPNVYNCSVTNKNLNNLYHLCNDKNYTTLYKNVSRWMESRKGEKFLTFAKSKYFRHDIMSAWIGPTLESDLLSETWQRRGESMITNCSSKYHVHNIKSINVNGTSFINYYDHSKWIVSLYDKKGWVCIGDINRSPTQRHRGGGYACTRNGYLFKLLKETVIEYEGCVINM
ncbi:DNase II [Fowlpox virus]|nr:DNase II [Fowlpox virus]CAE52578.1 putative DNaseII [Fowlpox virus isolate HP-438/Munich]URH25272.1 DNase II [Fowlpox virus]URH25791.1 DNase II [Fowlpox virus]URH26055.1 DNase II [Fowlpox virus]